VGLEGSGTGEPVNQYKGTSLVSGEVLECNFEEGDIVEKGDLLYVVDTKDVQNSIEKAQLNVEKAQMNYDEALKTRDNLDVTSDIGGIVTASYVSEGDNIQSGKQIAEYATIPYMLLKLPLIPPTRTACT
jgi:HlyD family secretion protein